MVSYQIVIKVKNNDTKKEGKLDVKVAKNVEQNV